MPGQRRLWPMNQLLAVARGSAGPQPAALRSQPGPAGDGVELPMYRPSSSPFKPTTASCRGSLTSRESLRALRAHLGDARQRGFGGILADAARHDNFARSAWPKSARCLRAWWRATGRGQAARLGRIPEEIRRAHSPADAGSDSSECTSTPASTHEFEFTDAEFKRLRELVHARTGIALSEAKRELVYGRLARRLRKLKLTLVRRVLPAGRNPENPRSCRNSPTRSRRISRRSSARTITSSS